MGSTQGNPVSGVRSLKCPNCGGVVEIRGLTHTKSAVCAQCLSVIDVQSPELRILQQFESRMRATPKIPLGKRGKWRGDPYEAIGFQVRSVKVEGERYSWDEYLLFNPYKGFRYLTCYRGHWNDVITLRNVPEPTTVKGRRAMRVLGETYRHFQTARATTDFILGEFPWEVRVGDTAQAEDYVAPPRMLSAEKTEGEVTWSLGEYVAGQQIWSAFQLPGAAPPAVGVYANQPSPYSGRARSMWQAALVMLMLWAVMLLGFTVFSRQQEVLRQANYFVPGAAGQGSYVTPVFELKGHPSSVEVRTETTLENQWIYLNYALINEQTGRAWDFGREVSYYHGVDGGESWSEGSRNDSAVIPAVPPGRYYLRVEPETDTTTPASIGRRIDYTIVVLRDVPSYLLLWLVVPLLLAPPVLRSVSSRSFEFARWQESDYAVESSGD